ncbi:MAG: phosphoglycerate mutase family protein [Acidimicrobiales bacterium]|nr:phosphoglycerate mutase family protein [Acidimicrobiales bacterium]
MSLIVVRHAHAGNRSAWTGADSQRPLSEKGEAQARHLVGPLVALEPKWILSSSAVRCRQTVEPLAVEIGLDVVDDHRLYEGASTRAVAELLDDVAGTTTVVCSHGDIIPRILDELIGRGMTCDDELRWQKASTWVIDHTRTTGWGHARYLPPPEKKG